MADWLIFMLQPGIITIGIVSLGLSALFGKLFEWLVFAIIATAVVVIWDLTHNPVVS